jgi:hypothetical protein
VSELDVGTGQALADYGQACEEQRPNVGLVVDSAERGRVQLEVGRVVLPTGLAGAAARLARCGAEPERSAVERITGGATGAGGDLVI